MSEFIFPQNQLGNLLKNLRNLEENKCLHSFLHSQYYFDKVKEYLKDEQQQLVWVGSQFGSRYRARSFEIR